MMFQAAATFTVVMGQAHDASIIEQVKIAKKYNAKVMCDVMLCEDKPGRCAAGGVPRCGLHHCPYGVR